MRGREIAGLNIGDAEELLMMVLNGVRRKVVLMVACDDGSLTSWDRNGHHTAFVRFQGFGPNGSNLDFNTRP
jgi:hypothetical protein